jgi:radical SAM-linked protein
MNRDGNNLAARARFRIRFRKGGDLRLVSHHDLLRCFERLLRRAEVPFHSTQGYNPKPRLGFPLSLGLGIVGNQEVAELDLDEDLQAEEVCERLARQCPPGLNIVRVTRLEPKARARVRRVGYRVAVPGNHLRGLAGRCAEVLAATTCPVERTRPRRRQFDLRPYLDSLQLQANELEIVLWITPLGSARPDEVLGLLGLGALLESGAVLERTTVELEDECATLAASSPNAGLHEDLRGRLRHLKEAFVGSLDQPAPAQAAANYRKESHEERDAD